LQFTYQAALRPDEVNCQGSRNVGIK